MAASEGVDLEWAIVKLSRKEDINKLKRQYSTRIIHQAQQCLKNIQQEVGKSFQIAHSDEEGISGRPEPKTDLIIYAKNKKYHVSVKMSGGVQLASGQGQSTADLFRETGAAVFADKPKKMKEVESLAKIIEQMPTKLLAPQNLDRILEEADPKVLKEFVTKTGRIHPNKNAETWLDSVKPDILDDIRNFMRDNPEFYTEIVRESLTGKRTLKGFKGASADHILSPLGFNPINESLVNAMKKKVKLDIRAKSRSGITSIAFRIDLMS